MPKRISAITEAIGRGVFLLIEQPPPAIVALGTGRAVMIASSLPWGPVNDETDFVDPATFRDTFAPNGFPRTGNAYLTMTRVPWVDAHIIRVTGVGALAATAQVEDSVPANSIKLTAKYVGSAPNAIMSVIIAAATDAVANHFNMTVQIVDPTTGLDTTELYENVDSTQVPDDSTHFYWATLIKDSKLVGTLLRQTGARPANGTVAFSGGTDGATLVASDYLGTPGSPDKGVSLLENDPDVDVFFCDAVPTGILAAVNAGLEAHAVAMADQRIYFASDSQGVSTSTAKTDAATLSSDHGIFTYQYAQVFDDTGVLTGYTIPVSGLTAALATLLPAHLSLAIKDSRFTKFLSAIKGLDTIPKQSLRADLEKHGVLAWEKNSDGVFSPYADTMTDGKTDFFVTRMADWIAESAGVALEQFKGSLNDSETIEDERTMISTFLAKLVADNKRDHIAFPNVKAAALLPLESSNTEASLDAGQVIHNALVQLWSDEKEIILKLAVGTGVTVTPVTG